MTVLTLTYPDGNSAVFDSADECIRGDGKCFQPIFWVFGPLPAGNYKAVIVGTSTSTGAPVRAEGIYRIGG